MNARYLLFLLWLLLAPDSPFLFLRDESPSMAAPEGTTVSGEDRDADDMGDDKLDGGTSSGSVDSLVFIRLLVRTYE